MQGLIGFLFTGRMLIMGCCRVRTMGRLTIKFAWGFNRLCMGLHVLSILECSISKLQGSSDVPRSWVQVLVRALELVPWASVTGTQI